MGFEDILVFAPYILMVQILGYLQTPCTGGFRHSDEAIFGIFLISMNLHRHSEGAGSNSYNFSIFDLPLVTLFYACFARVLGLGLGPQLQN